MKKFLKQVLQAFVFIIVTHHSIIFAAKPASEEKKEVIAFTLDELVKEWWQLQMIAQTNLFCLQSSQSLASDREQRAPTKYKQWFLSREQARRTRMSIVKKESKDIIPQLVESPLNEIELLENLINQLNPQSFTFYPTEELINKDILLRIMAYVVCQLETNTYTKETFSFMSKKMLPYAQKNFQQIYESQIEGQLIIISWQSEDINHVYKKERAKTIQLWSRTIKTLEKIIDSIEQTDEILRQQKKAREEAARRQQSKDAWRRQKEEEIRRAASDDAFHHQQQQSRNQVEAVRLAIANIGGSPYARLGVAKNASAEEIRTAYLQRTREHHPDKGGNTAEQQRIVAARELLLNPEQRKIYDQTHRSTIQKAIRFFYF